MQELAFEDFHKVNLLLTGGHMHPEVISIIEQNNPGWIFVDQLTRPRSALVWSKEIQGFYLIGDHTNEEFLHNLDDFIKKRIEPRMTEHSLKHLEISGHHNEWNLESIFTTRNLYQFEQLVFKMLNKPHVIKRKALKTLNLKTQAWENQEFKNASLIKDHLELFWSSKDDFKKKGYGYVAVDGTEIIGICYSSFVTSDSHAIGIETIPRAQNKGVGTYLASLLVEEILENGFTPYWDCSLDNESSKKLAVRLGFIQVHRYKCSGFEL